MDMDYEKKGNEIVFTFSGEFIAGEVAKYREKIKNLITSNIKSVVFDFKDVDFIDSSGLGYVVAIFKHLREKNCSFVLKNVQPNVKNIFQLTKIDKILNISD